MVKGGSSEETHLKEVRELAQGAASRGSMQGKSSEYKGPEAEINVQGKAKRAGLGKGRRK